MVNRLVAVGQCEDGRRQTGMRYIYYANKTWKEPGCVVPTLKMGTSEKKEPAVIALWTHIFTRLGISEGSFNMAMAFPLAICRSITLPPYYEMS